MDKIALPGGKCTGDQPLLRAINVENASMSWRHHEYIEIREYLERSCPPFWPMSSDQQNCIRNDL